MDKQNITMSFSIRVLEMIDLIPWQSKILKVKAKSLSPVRLLATPWTAAYRLLRPWDFPGKSTGLGCHCLLRSLKAAIRKYLFFRCSGFFAVQLSHPYMTPGKKIALTIPTFVGEVISLLFNMLSSFVTVFLPRSKCLLTSWL